MSSILRPFSAIHSYFDTFLSVQCSVASWHSHSWPLLWYLSGRLSAVHTVHSSHLHTFLLTVSFRWASDLCLFYCYFLLQYIFWIQYSHLALWWRKGDNHLQAFALGPFNSLEGRWNLYMHFHLLDFCRLGGYSLLILLSLMVILDILTDASFIRYWKEVDYIREACWRLETLVCPGGWFCSLMWVVIQADAT